MKKVLAVVFAVAIISLGALSASAQVPNIAIYFDDLLHEQQGYCEDHFVGHVDSLNVVMLNFNSFISTVEFGTDFYGEPLVDYLADLHVPSATLWLGNSYIDGPGGAIDGVTITYQIPQNAFDPFVCMKLLVQWKCDSCVGQTAQPIAVVPHEGTGDIIAIEWQTFRIIDAVGFTSQVCPGEVSTEESSWGRVKALYGNE